MAQQIYVYEFLYRSNTAAEQGAWHVILGSNTTDPITGAVTPYRSDVMSMTQAAAYGFTLPVIIADINAQTLTALDAASARIAQLLDEVAQAQAIVEAAPADVSADPASPTLWQRMKSLFDPG